MRLRGIGHDHLELAIDGRADRAAAAPQLVVVEMLIIELKTTSGAEERPGLQRQHMEIDRAAADSVQALDHRRDFRRGHVGAEDRHLLAGALPLADQRLAVLQARDEADPIEQRAILGPVLDLADVLEENRAVPVPGPRRGDDEASVADRFAYGAHQRIVAEAVAGAKRRTGGE